MNYTLINFNIPNDLKHDLDMLARSKRVSKTSIINTLLERYCRKEMLAITEAKEIRKLAELHLEPSEQDCQDRYWKPPMVPDDPDWIGGQF